MKAKLLTLLTALLFFGSGAWGDTEPNYSVTSFGTDDFSTVMTSHDGISISTDYTAWTGNSSGAYYLRLGDNPSGLESKYLKIASSSEIGKVSLLVAANGSTAATPAVLGYNSSTISKENIVYKQTPFTVSEQKGSQVWKDIDLSEVNVKVISVHRKMGKSYIDESSDLGNGASICVYGIKVWLKEVDTRTSVSLSFPNATEEATLGSSFSAPTLTVDPVAATSAVTYTSGTPSVAEVNASTGAITLKAAGTTVITAAISSDATYKDASASYTLVVTDPNAPSLSVSPTSLSLLATANVPSPIATFTVAGENLTDGNYTISVPSVDGLGVSPASVTVTDGSVNQEVTVTYAPSVDAASSSADITLTIDEIVASVAVNYEATLSVYTQETVNDITTWDFVNDIDHENSSDVRRTQSADLLYANTSGITFSSNFNKASLLWSTSGNYYGYRNANKCSQGATLKFKTSVAGMVTVLFANNGGNNGTCYAKVNDTVGTKGSSDGGNSGVSAIEESFLVSAGNVTITSDKPTAVRFFKIVFTPTVATTIGATGWSTYSSDKALDFANAVRNDGEENDLEAYIVSGFTGTALTKSDALASAPAETGLLLNGTAGKTYTIPVSASPAALPATNCLVAAVAGGTVSAGTGDDVNYVLVNNGGSPVFQWIGSTTATLGANKAYLTLENGPKETEARGLWFDEGETTGVVSVGKPQTAGSCEVYNLNGQRVNASHKGIVIVNGKKYLNK